ncbi:organic cation transporter protein-like [Haliotis rubra]|uniref:organic cation transporter protein-like n=1 Tax=Haliotis rubra TaxID=36100 RepID=UPI001EE53C73|nr:organic cation transporter protein-like [Haliotis rubra]
MKFDDVLALLGEFGPYQKRLYFLVCLTGICVAFQTLASVFTLTVPAHRCKIPGYDNDTYAVQSSYHRQLINLTIPVSDGKYSKCEIYTNRNSTILSRGDNLTKRECDSWVYDRSTFVSTIATDLNIVCGDRVVRTLSNSLVLAGKLVGSTLQCFISDIFGRKKAFLMFLFLMILTGFANYFPYNFTMLMVFRFLAGLTTTSTFLGAFVIGVEFVGPSKRVWTGLVIELFWVLGMIIMAGLAFLLPDWHHLVLALASPAVLFLSYWWLIPESPRWLMSKGRLQEAENIVRKAAKVNKITLPETLFDDKTMEAENEPKGKLIEMFTNKTLAVRSLILFYIWMVSSLVYYGLTLNVSNLSGNIFVNFVLSALVEAVGYILSIFLLDRVGRRVLLCALMSLGGVACVLTVFPAIYASGTADWSLMMLSLVGKMGSSGAFGVIYIFTAELYPTPLRNIGLGVNLTFSRIGGVISPFISDLGILVGGTFGEQALPLVVFGVTAVLAGGLALALPETLNRKLPETVEDAKQIGSSTKHKYKMRTEDQAESVFTVAYKNTE